ncbi:MAG: glycosyltransferase [Pseudomonadota bacterium]
MKQTIKAVFLPLVSALLGQKAWPAGQPEVTQGFAGESLGSPQEMREFPRISVVMPVYNACRIDRQFLLRALESIAKQSYRNVELIIVDDGSTDDTRQVCEDFLARHPDLRAKFLSKENAGQSCARNFGAKACSGEYIGFLDQDDEWYENKLEQVVPWLANKKIDVLYTDSDTIDGNGAVTLAGIHRQHHFGWPHPKKVIEDVLFKDVFVMPGLMTIKKEAFDRVGGFDEQLSGYEDDDLFLRLYESCNIFYLPVPTLRWRMYGDNYSFSHRMLTSRTYFWRKLLKNYTDQGVDRFRVQMISLRFFWQFMGQARAQYLSDSELCWQSLRGAKEILPFLPWFQRLLFSFIFMFPSKMVLPLLLRGRGLVRSG